MRNVEKLIALCSLLFASFLIAPQNTNAQSSNVWSASGQMAQPRTGAASAPLSDGRILITGGSDSNGVPQASTEIFDPVTGQFSQGAPMNMPRANHAAITLNTGDVLITGGLTTGGGYSDTSEILNIQTGTWTLLEASLGTGLAKHAMAALPDGNVLIAGGESTTGPVLTLLLFRVSDGSISSVGSLLTARADAAAAATPDGRVLIAGGTDMNGAILSSTEIFVYSPDTQSGATSTGPNMTYPRAKATATSTYDGVAVIGGNNGSIDLGTAEIFSQWTNALRVVNGATPRSGHIAALLPKNGSILAMGGTGGTAVDLLQPWGNNLAGVFVAGARSTVDHTGGFVAPGNLGTLLAAGGTGSSANAAELYWFPTIATDQPDYAPGTPVVMTGVGFQPGETVNLYLREYVNQMLVDPPDYSVTADAAGTFTFAGYAPTPSDLGGRYHLTATGTTSGYQAQTIFTDSTSVKTATIVMQDSGCTTNLTTFSQGQSICADVDVTATNGSGASSFFVVWSNPSSVTVRTTTELIALGTVHDVFSTTTSNPTGTWTVKVCNNATCTGGNLVTSTTFTLTPPFPTSIGVSSATGTYGGSVNLSATLTVTSGGAAVSGQSIAFKLNGTTVGAANTDNNGTATLSNISLSGISAGTYASGITATFAGGSGYASSSGTGSLTVNQASATINVTPYTATYDGNPHTATGTATGDGGADLSADLDLSGTAHTSAGSYATDAWKFHDPTGNYADAGGSVTDVINKANANISVTPYSVTYDATPHTATGKATGVGATDLSAGISLSGTTHTNAHTYASDSWTFHDASGNYADANGTVSDVINQATATISVTPYTATYDGSAHTATGSAKGVGGIDLISGLDLTKTAHTNAATYTADPWTFKDSEGNYTDSSGAVNDLINKSDAKITVTPYSVTYDGQAHTAVVASISGVNGETGSTVGTVDVSNTTHTNAKTYSTDSWTFAGTANYNNIASTTITDSIAKANATVDVTPYDVTYDGHAHTAIVASINGVHGETGSTVGTVDLSNTTHTNAATYSDTWSLAGTANYNDISPTAITDTIAKANATVNVTPYNVTYDGQSHTAGVTSISGVNGETGNTVGTVDVSNTTHTSAGTYSTDSWSFSGTANYNNVAATIISDSIAKANATINVTPYNLAYDGHSHTATVTSISGVNGETGSTVGTVDVSNTTHTGAGTYSSDSWSFSGTANYNNIAGTAIVDSIAKANATVNVTPYSLTYDGHSHTATVTSISGVNGETGSTVGTVDASNTTHTNAGTYSDSWTFTGTGNYNNGSGTVDDTISKANAVVSVSPYSVTYDAVSHTATGTAKGVQGESLAGLNLSGTAHTNAGTFTDSWTFTDSTGNYNNGSGTVDDTISKANAVVSVSPYSVTYDAISHTATGSATGVNGDTLGGLDLTGTNHTNANSYTDPWTFTDSTGNYNNASGTVSDLISRATATVNMTPYSLTYDGNAHTATGSVTGVKGESLSGLNLGGTTHTNAATYDDTWTFNDTTGNYSNATGTVQDVIKQASATVVVTPYSVIYDSNAHTATATATGVGGIDLIADVTLTGTTHTNAGNYNTDGWIFHDTNGNYADASGVVSDIIQRANQTVLKLNATSPVTFGQSEILSAIGGTTNGTVTYNLVSGLCAILGNQLTANSGTGICTLTATMAGNGNYNDVTSEQVSVTLAKANQAVLTLNAASPLIYNQKETLSVSGGTTAGTVIYSLISGSCSMSGSQLTASSGSGSCSLTATMAGNDNYNDVISGQVAVDLARANVTVGFSNVGPFVFDGIQHAPNYVVNGVNGEVLTSSARVSYSGAAGTTYSSSSAPSSPGSYQQTVIFDGNNNYNALSPSATEGFAITYRFLGLGAPYAPPPTTFNVTRTMPLAWQYTNANGAVVNSAAANSQVQIYGPYNCSQLDTAGDITVNSAGASGYQYNTTTNTWQFNWQVKGNAPGCYGIYIVSGQTGQKSGPFPIQVISH
jgi:hypothetical protein